jgi:hypothetical protein
MPAVPDSRSAAGAQLISWYGTGNCIIIAPLPEQADIPLMRFLCQGVHPCLLRNSTDRLRVVPARQIIRSVTPENAGSLHGSRATTDV